MANIERWEAVCPNCNGRGHEGAGDLEDDYPCRACMGAQLVEVVPASQLRGAVEALRAIQRELGRDWWPEHVDNRKRSVWAIAQGALNDLGDGKTV